MNQALKQRLIGAAVLVALGIIFLPSLFNGGRPQQAEAVMNAVPAPPEVAAMEFKQPVRSPQLEAQPEKPVEEMYSLAPKSPEGATWVQENPPEHPALDKQGLPRAWVLQVASFSDQVKADELKKALQEKKYKAFTRSVTREGKQLVRVLIGPELDAAKLNNMKKQVDKEYNVKSLIIKYES